MNPADKLRYTPLRDAHLAAGARMVPFGGWEMPLHYGSQLEEHHAVRLAAGAFDVAHMLVADLQGPGATALLRRLLANDVARLADSQGLYSCMLNERAGIIDDLICYRLRENSYRLVLNAATADSDLAWISQHAADEKQETRIVARRDLGIVAVQGPQARAQAAKLLPSASAALALQRFAIAELGDYSVARTGYTGEDGFEILLPLDSMEPLWNGLLALGVHPCGLGARDTLRLEAGLNLYGHDMDTSVSPLECGLAWTVAWEAPDDRKARQFIGRAALQRLRDEGVQMQRQGLVLLGKGVMRDHMVVETPLGEGVVTSGGFGPTVGRSIALARLPVGASGTCQVKVRGKLLPATIVSLPFVRAGKSLVPPREAIA